MFKFEVLFGRVVTVVFCMTIILVDACSLADEINAPSPSDKSEQADPFSENGRKAGDRAVKVVDGVEFAFRWCPPGTYTMGSPISENGRYDNEEQHLIKLTKGFWMLETEVTVAMFKAFVKDTKYEVVGDDPVAITHFSTPPIWGSNPNISWENPGFTQSDSHPVTCVSWDDAMAFCKWLEGKLGKNVQLPSDKQWEYACRAGTTEMFSDNLDEIAWYWDNGDYKTHPVGTKKPNAWDLFDMHGNVWEWCLDVVDNSNPGLEICIRRGGGFGAIAEGCRCARRYPNVRSKRSVDIGFRCAIVPESTPIEIDLGAKDLTPIDVDFGDGTQAGERKTCVVNGVEFAFRWCPPGTFAMGSPESEEGRKNDELQHEVTLTKGFWMMETEVTHEQWRAVMGKNISMGRIGQTPIGYVSWDDCQLFCQRCTTLGLSIQLPTEAQWEYACRAGTMKAFAGEINEMGWVKPASLETVKMKKPNGWGLYDMHGNVYEWCSDWYADYQNRSETDPEGPPSGSHRVIRGGCSLTDKNFCRSANRGKCVPNYKSASFIGFRCVVGKGVPSTYAPLKAAAKPRSNVVRIGKFGKGTKAGERKTAVINGVTFAFRWCPPGTFMMGSPESEEGRELKEKQHQVTLTKGFWMMETEVTQEQWRVIMGHNSSYFKGDKLPVDYYSWNDCQQFCAKCADLGLPVQLPTETQWEYACRAGTTGAYAGNLDEMGWYSANSGGRTHSVGKKKPNAWGLFDMHGNVFEWCQDFYGAYPGEKVTNSEAVSNGAHRVYRGGNSTSDADRCRSASRNKYHSMVPIVGVGFRCVINQ